MPCVKGFLPFCLRLCGKVQGFCFHLLCYCSHLPLLQFSNVPFKKPNSFSFERKPAGKQFLFWFHTEPPEGKAFVAGFFKAFFNLRKEAYPFFLRVSPILFDSMLNSQSVRLYGSFPKGSLRGFLIGKNLFEGSCRNQKRGICAYPFLRLFRCSHPLLKALFYKGTDKVSQHRTNENNGFAIIFLLRSFKQLLNLLL